MIPAARTDPWRCSGCGAVHELATRSLEVGLVRLAVRGEQNFRLGSADIESHVEPLLEPCRCGGRLTHDLAGVSDLQGDGSDGAGVGVVGLAEMRGGASEEVADRACARDAHPFRGHRQAGREEAAVSGRLVDGSSIPTYK